MTPLQFKSAIAKVGLSQERAGLWFGRSEKTGQRWAVGEYPVPDYVARWLRYMIKNGLRPVDFET